MIKGKTVRALASLLAILMVLSMVFTSCGKNSEATELSFAKANSIEEMEKLDGQRVSIIGYMSTLSPIDGRFMYLMNMPYQSCPFCIPDTTQLSNTLAVYSKDGKAFEFTDLLIRVEGVLEFNDFTDEYGYQYSYRIKDATYKKMDTSELGEKYLLWQQLAQTGVVADVYAMHDYIYFLCFWTQLTAEFQGIGSDYIYPENVQDFIQIEGSQFNYASADGYFDDMVRRIEEVDAEAFAGLVQNIRSAEELANDVLSQLERGKYKAVAEYSGYFGDGRTQYKMDDQDDFENAAQAVFSEFSSWIAEWEI